MIASPGQPMVKISSEYLAGYIDADGCIDIARDSPRVSYVRIQVGSINRLPLERFQDRFGGSIIHKKVSNGPYWNWVIKSNKAKMLLESILPFLVNKQEEAKLALRFSSIVHSVGGRHGLTDEEIQERDFIRKELSLLKPTNVRRLKGVS
jgi:hypothetical protein